MYILQNSWWNYWTSILWLSCDTNFSQIFVKTIKTILQEFDFWQKRTSLVNLISIIAKNYIFKCKLTEQRLNIVEFKHKIMWYRSLEQYISKKNNTILAFEQMWTPLQYIFN